MVNNTTKASFHFIEESGNWLDCRERWRASVTLFALCSSVFGFVDSGHRQMYNPGEDGRVWGAPVQQETFCPGRSILDALPCLWCVNAHRVEISWLCVLGQRIGLLWASISRSVKLGKEKIVFSRIVLKLK